MIADEPQSRHDIERQAFEAWLHTRNPIACIERGASGEYIVTSVKYLWVGWSGRATCKQTLQVPAVSADTDPVLAALTLSMQTLRQIAETPRNRGARRNARATVRFLEAMTEHSAGAAEMVALRCEP